MGTENSLAHTKWECKYHIGATGRSSSEVRIMRCRIHSRHQREQRTEKILRFSHITNLGERKKMIDNYNADGYLFIQDNGTVMTPNALNHWLIRFSDKVGFRVHPHKFRHTQASLLIANGVDVVSVSKRLGHAQVSTTQNIYSHCLKKADRQCADTLSDLFGQKTS